MPVLGTKKALAVILTGRREYTHRGARHARGGKQARRHAGTKARREEIRLSFPSCLCAFVPLFRSLHLRNDHGLIIRRFVFALPVVNCGSDGAEQFGRCDFGVAIH